MMVLLFCRWIATTQFEPTAARAAFPCFDEPHLKANFTMRMTHSPEYHSLFNTRLIHTNTKDQLVEDTYEETVRMSTYLVAFIVCDYKHKETETSRGIKVDVKQICENVHTVVKLYDNENFFRTTTKL